VGDIDAAVVDGLKAIDPRRSMREPDKISIQRRTTIQCIRSIEASLDKSSNRVARSERSAADVTDEAFGSAAT
jgi:hypothetical protein